MGGLPESRGETYWQDEKWETPYFKEEFNPDRIILTLLVSKNRNLVNNLAENLSEKQREVLEMILAKPSLTSQEIAKALGITRQAVSDRLKSLKNKNLIRRTGSYKTGHWEALH